MWYLRFDQKQLILIGADNFLPEILGFLETCTLCNTAYRKLTHPYLIGGFNLPEDSDYAVYP